MQTPPPLKPGPRHRLANVLWPWLVMLPVAFAEPGPRTGEQIYQAQCVSCHGASGEGSKEYAKPLVGNRSTAQLSRLIAKTMPEDDPGTCVGEDADKVAAYIYDAFYSKTAQARLKPARIELSRLTVRQYRNAVADLVGFFREPGTLGPERARSSRGILQNRSHRAPATA